MKNSFKKYFIGLGVFILLFTSSCSKRESSTGATDQAASTSFTNAQNTLTALGLGITIPTIGDFADTTGGNTAALTSVFGGNDSKTAGFDTAKFTGLESAITDLQSSLTSYTGAPKRVSSLSPSLAVASYKNSDLAYIHFLLGYYYTLHAVLKLRVFVAQGIVVLQGSRYALNWTDTDITKLEDKAIQAILDAYYMLNGVRYKVKNGAGVYIVAHKLPAGSTRCASYHLDKAISYAGSTFPQLKTALTSLQKDSFKAFFDEIAAKATALGITETALATD